jgi:hypothetical protein
LNSVVTDLNSVNEIIKILKEELDCVGMEVRNGVGTIQSKNKVSDYSEDDWNLMNQKHTTKQRNFSRYIPVPVITSNRFSVLENSQHSCEIISRQPPIKSSWSDAVMSRQKKVAYGKQQNISRIPVIKNCSNLPCNGDACETSSSNLTGNQEVGKQSKKQISAKKMKHKILIIGDCHGRECASKVKYNLDNDFEVQGVINPGASLTANTNSVKEEVKL